MSKPATGFVGSVPGHGAADLVSDLLDGGAHGEQMARQYKVRGLKPYGPLGWDDLVKAIKAATTPPAPPRPRWHDWLKNATGALVKEVAGAVVEWLKGVSGLFRSRVGGGNDGRGTGRAVA